MGNQIPETCILCSPDQGAAREYIQSLIGWKLLAEVTRVTNSDEYVFEFVLVRVRRRARVLPMEDVEYALAAAEYYREEIGLSETTADDIALTLLPPCDVLFAPLETLIAVLGGHGFSVERITEIHAEIKEAQA